MNKNFKEVIFMVFLKKIPKKLNINWGFTLVEIIIVIAVAGILLLAVSNLFISSGNIFYTFEDRANLQRDIRFLNNYIKENISYSEKVKIVSDFQTASSSLNTGEAIIGLDGTKIKYKEAGFSERIIANLPSDIGFKIEQTNDSDDEVISIIVNVNEKNKSIILNNCKNGDIIGDTSGSSIVFLK